MVSGAEGDRDVVAAAHRVVVKVGSSSLTSAAGGIDPERIGALVDALVAARLAGREVVLVSSGAIAAGLAPLGMKARPRDLANQQAAASVGQSLLMEHYGRLFARAGLGVGQVLLTVDDVTRRGNYRNAFRTFGRLLKLGVVPVVNENDTVATHEIRFGDNDRLAALVAHLVHADALVLLSDVDALWTAHPAEPGAGRIDVVAGPPTSPRWTSPGAVPRSGPAACRPRSRRPPSRPPPASPSCSPTRRTPAAALTGERVGTLFTPTGKRRPTRLLWLRHASETKGRLVLDAGAVRAVVQRKASLLPAGITEVEGHFASGEPVDLVDPDGVVVARGLVAYDSDELPALLGRTTQDLAAERGAAYDRTVVHRDALVVLGD